MKNKLRKDEDYRLEYIYQIKVNKKQIGVDMHSKSKFRD